MSLVLNVCRDDLLNALASVQSITVKKGTIVILANVLIESQDDAIIITATDLETGMKRTIPAEIVSPGSITLPARKLFEIVKESNSDHIHLEISENNWARISDESSNYRLAGLPFDDFPEFPEHKEDKLISIHSEALLDLINKTIFSVAQDMDNQFTLASILVEKKIRDDKNLINFVSSDGHRLSLMEKEIGTDINRLENDNPILIPKKGIHEIKKLCEWYSGEVLFGVDKDKVIFKAEDILYVIRLMKGTFPEFDNLIDIIDREKFFNVDRICLLNSLRRVNLFTESKYNLVTFQVENDKLTLLSHNTDIGDAKEEIDTSYNGDSLKLGFNGKFFVETLQLMSSDTVRLYMNDPGSPCLIESENDPDFISIVMPMHL